VLELFTAEANVDVYIYNFQIDDPDGRDVNTVSMDNRAVSRTYRVINITYAKTI
jgi:hypothetical protein